MDAAVRTLRLLLVPVATPWCVFLAALGAAMTAFPEGAGQNLGEPQPGGLTVSVAAARPGSPPGRELTIVLADPPPVASAAATGTLTGVIGGPPSFHTEDMTNAGVFLSMPPAGSNGVALADAVEDRGAFEQEEGDVVWFEDGDLVPASAEGVDFEFVFPAVSLHGSRAWGVELMTSPATGSLYGALWGAAINLLWLAGIPLLWSAGWVAWRLRPTRRVEPAA